MKYLKNRIKFLNENDYFDHIEYTTQNGSVLIEDSETGIHYSSKNILFGKNDVAGGEIVPPLGDTHVDVDASDIGLKTLKYFPSKNIGSFNVSDNLLTDLEHCPMEIDGNFIADSNNLTSLKGTPEQVNGYIELSNNNLTSLKEIINLECDELYLDGNVNLISTEGLSKVKTSHVYLNGCNNLKDLKELPEHIEHLEISNTGIKSMKTFFDNKIDKPYLRVDDILCEDITDFEKEFFGSYLDINNHLSYEQLIANHLISCFNEEYEEYEESDVLEYLKFSNLDFSKIKVEDKYKNIFSSIKTINKFSL